MRVLLAGTPAIVIPLFEKVLHSDIEVAGVITNPPKPRGRSGKPEDSPVAKWAKNQGIPLFESGKLEEIEPFLSAVDCVFVVAFGKLIPRKFLDLPRRGWINLHFSTLPEARGAAPVQHLIAAGREKIGYTLFKLNEGMDTGPIHFRSELFDIDSMPTGEVWDFLVEKAARDIVPNLRLIHEGHIPFNQEEYFGDIALAPKITPEEARINWDESAPVIAQKIRAFNPTPTAWTKFRDQRFLIHAATPSVKSGDLIKPGQLRFEANQVCVGSSDGFLVLQEVQPFGGRKMSAAAWANGSRIEIGESFD